MTDRELMQEALYALTYVGDAKEIYSDTIESLRARLAQPEQQHSEQWWKHEVSNAYANGYEKGRASVKQPEQEPAAWMVITMGEVTSMQPHMIAAEMLDGTHQLYTAPPQREWQTLTENEIKHLWYEACQTNLELTSQLIVHLARNIEAKLKEKNNG